MVVDSKVIHIKPGMGVHTELTFDGEGHMRPGQPRSDLVIQFKEKAHEKFKRFGNDLIYEHSISLEDSLRATPITVHTIENEQLEIAVDEVIQPSTVKVVHGKGMPIEDKSDPLAPVRRNLRKGNLIIKFNIQFPQKLSED